MSGRRQVPLYGRKKKKKLRPAGIAVIIVLAFCILALAGYLILSGRFAPAEQSAPSSESSVQDSTSGSGSDDSKTSEDGSDPSESEGGSSEESSSESSEESVGYPVLVSEGDEQKYSAVFRLGDAGYEYYTYVPSLGEAYAKAVSDAADGLAGVADVYDLTIPTSSGIVLPDALWGRDDITSNQQEAEEDIHSMMSANVRSVPLFDILMKHRNEYLYFRTDHHWTALGAYYAYTAFCEEKGIKANAVTKYASVEYPGFLGTFYGDCGNNPLMAENPDTVVTYPPLSKNATMVFTDKNGSEISWPIVNDVTDYSASYKYGAFIAGDNPYSLIENPDAKDDSSCVVIKESFGNAFVPFLVDHYKTIHVVDYRYWQGNLGSFVRENGIDDVIFINNLSAIRGKFLVGKLQGII